MSQRRRSSTRAQTDDSASHPTCTPHQHRSQALWQQRSAVLGSLLAVESFHKRRLFNKNSLEKHFFFVRRVLLDVQPVSFSVCSHYVAIEQQSITINSQRICKHKLPTIAKIQKEKKQLIKSALKNETNNKHLNHILSYLTAKHCCILHRRYRRKRTRRKIVAH